MREVSSPSLADLTTLRIGGKALAALRLERASDFEVLPMRLRALGGRPLVLGAGSNILARDGELPIVLICPDFLRQLEVVSEKDDKVCVRAGAAVPMARLVRFCARHGLSGLEGLVGIPGRVGGGIAMNAGSFGTEICAALESVQILSGNSVHKIPARDMRFGYRSFSVSKGILDFVVLEAIFSLIKLSIDGIRNSMRHNFFEKKSKQPLTAWSAGCVFKNPPSEMPAGRLLELSGYKGKKLGGMAFSSLHANFLLNEGRGCATAALDLIHEAREAVRRRFGCMLELEVRVTPCLC
ncbi:MAG: UDP-N-acetylmuramate dehydrogenase [Candidatus Desulfovibrio kirbyi]|jgi:UDP-N-acetylmuramate dehydrogenase|uniref:UDP-N-acetylenolpyruvoylglucosamine reductase n=1 Tax=Candidatus Desulfovibrio kirbyi TaxID=2696086 RepID=A0A6L2R4P7_9BACT|nr:UDP-N-acetylmuramate dehydrogenase [Desulfovibrio sp.]GFH62485.1 MAG: UDP-N-acetylmuramate dehydrogenase [Candidatus Desulfovibrio kirbyi]